MIDRRDLLNTTGWLAASRVLAAARSMKVHFGCQTNAWPVDPRDFSSLQSVIQKIKNYGYEGFETGFANVQGQFDRSTEAKAQINEIGIRFFGVHIFLAEYDPETCIAPASLYERIAHGAAKLGAERLILSGSPAVDEAARRKKAEALNRAGTFSAKLGLSFAYHNHGPEFAAHGEEIEALLQQTDPAKVNFLLDAGHAFEAGADVPGFVHKHYRRLTGMHLRDFKDGRQVPLGSGDFPLQSLADTIRKTDWSGWLLNEEERPSSKPGDTAVRPASEALFRAFGRSPV